VSQTCFSPESPVDRTTRLVGQALHAEVNLYPDKWPPAARAIAIDCVKWLCRGVESINCRRDSNGVKFVKLSVEQNDALYLLYYSVTF